MAIHIKKANRGKFTAYKKRTGKTTEEALHSSNAHVRQMANFARNAKKWHHELGGYLMELGGYLAKGGSLEEIRKRPGGSNVGKKTFANGKPRTGPYAGPSGGAPKGSYPIPDLAHGRAALRLAGHAPNPAGIRAKVYAKYPELRKALGGYLAKGGSLTSGKAKEILRDGTAQGHKLTPKQKKYFGWVAGGKRENGGFVVPLAALGIDLSQYNSYLPIQQVPMSTPGSGANLSGVTSGAGVVGSIIGIGDQIAAPIKEGAERYSPNGGLVSTGRVARAAQAGLAFDPLRTGIKTFTDPDASRAEKWGAIGGAMGLPGLASKFGKARANRLDEQSKEKYNNAFMGQANNLYTNMINSQLREYAMGGDMGGNNVVEYKGASHAQGGIQVDANGTPVVKSGKKVVAEVEGGELEWGGYVFSNKLMYHGK